MVNIVVVSHSRKLADGVIELASQMTQGKVKFAAAAGIDDPDNPIGTDPVAVMTAIQQLLDDDVLVMVDMGSAILSTDMAKELLGDEMISRVQVCAAPLVEGTVAAAVAAAAGQSIHQVMAEAHQALVAKYAQLGQSELLAGIPQPAAASVTAGDSKSFSWQVTNPTGIHARPASAIARCLNQFDADVQLVNGERTLNAKSMNNVALLGIKCGDFITLHARGPQAQAALDAFAALAATEFGDRPEAADLTSAGHAQGETLHAVSVRVRRIERSRPQLGTLIPAEPGEEIARLSNAIAVARQELDALSATTAEQLSEHEAAIFSAHQMMLEDNELYEMTIEQLAQRTAPVAEVWLQVVEQMAEEYRAIEDLYLRERYIDVYDVGFRVLRLLLGYPLFNLPTDKQPTLMIANYLLPSEVMTLDSAWVKGICFTACGANSHSALLAKARGMAILIDSNGQNTHALQEGSVVKLTTEAGNITILK